MATTENAAEFLKGWVSGYLAAGGELTDDDLGEKAAAAYERHLHPPDLPEPVRTRLLAALARRAGALLRASVGGDDG